MRYYKRKYHLFPLEILKDWKCKHEDIYIITSENICSCYYCGTGWKLYKNYNKHLIKFLMKFENIKHLVVYRDLTHSNADGIDIKHGYKLPKNPGGYWPTLWA
jgi:hypothetical protein